MKGTWQSHVRRSGESSSEAEDDRRSLQWACWTGIGGDPEGRKGRELRTRITMLGSGLRSHLLADSFGSCSFQQLNRTPNVHSA
jgi:hypothetical protein